jgi:hypothetical protein
MTDDKIKYNLKDHKFHARGKGKGIYENDWFTGSLVTYGDEYAAIKKGHEINEVQLDTVEMILEPRIKKSEV